MYDKNYFWMREIDSNKNIGYRVFSKKHLLMLLVVVLFTFFITLIYIHANAETQSMIRKVTALTLMVSEAIKLLVIYSNRNL